MGAKASKAAQTTTRKFPIRAPGAVPPPSRPAARRPSVPPTGPKASFAKDEAIRADGLDPDPMTNPAFSQRLQQMGIATPNPTLSNSSTASPGPPASAHSPLGPTYPSSSRNPTLSALEARQRIQVQFEEHIENPTGERAFADVGTLRQVLIMRRRGASPSDIEHRLRLKRGVVVKVESGGAIAPFT
ncbi:hypothetical protein BJ170DRAFT_629114 [Xylariales sp. AK1849]|nr:hypothetical protein BJ170DRAFT_629114 [Xylariales sp. AK1849]